MADGLAGNPNSGNWLINWLRNNTGMGQALAPTLERQQAADTMAAIRAAGVDIDRSRPQVQMPAPQAPQGYSVEDMMRSMVSEEARRKARGQY
jgi:hypothetical protein